MERKCETENCLGVIDFGEVPQGVTGVISRCPLCETAWEYDLFDERMAAVVDDS